MQSRFYRKAETLLIPLPLTKTIRFIAASSPAGHNIQYLSLSIARLTAEIRGRKSELYCLLSILKALMMGETAGEEPGAHTQNTLITSHQFWISEALKYLHRTHRQATICTYELHADTSLTVKAKVLFV